MKKILLILFIVALSLCCIGCTDNDSTLTCICCNAAVDSTDKFCPNCGATLDTNTDNTPTDGENGDENNNQSNQTSPNEIDWSRHSELLKNLCENEEYDTLIAQAKHISYFVTSNMGYFEPHPYAFLEDQGYDIEAIKKDRIEVQTFSFIAKDKPNSLFINTRVLCDDILPDQTHWVSYLLEYELTDKEVSDYHSLHSQPGYYFVQSYFINNEIARTRSPVFVDKTMLSTELYDILNRIIAERKLVSTKNCRFVISNFNTDDYTFDLIVAPCLTDYKTVYNRSNIFKGTYSTGRANMKNYVLLSIGLLLSESGNGYIGTTYLPQDIEIYSIRCEDFEDKP